jgi:hypothetical protein
MPESSLLVLAAGVGKRYQGLKQVDAVGPAGETLLEYSLFGAVRAGFRRLVFVIRHEIEGAFRDAVGRHWESRCDVRYVFQEIESGLPRGFALPSGRQKPWGTGHAVMLGRPAVSGPFAVINADDLYGPKGFRAMTDWLGTVSWTGPLPPEYCLVGYRLRNTLSEHGHVSRGICRIAADGYLTEVVERLGIEKHGQGARALDEEGGGWIPLSGDEVVSMNFWGFTPPFFDHLEEGFAAFLERSGDDPKAEYFIPAAVNELVREGRARVRYLPTPDRWFGLTYAEDLPLVRSHIRALVREGVYPEKIREGERSS